MKKYRGLWAEAHTRFILPAMKNVLFYIAILFLNVCYGENDRRIVICYSESSRIPYNTINLEFYNEPHEGYILHVVTTAMKGQGGFDYSNRDYKIKITEDYFNQLYKALSSLDVKEIVKNSMDVMGMDGSDINISIGNPQNYYSLNLWSPDNSEKQRKTEEVNKILREVFKKADLLEWLE